MGKTQFFAHLTSVAIVFIIIHAIFSNFSLFNGYSFNLVLCTIFLYIANQLSKWYIYDVKINPINKAVFITGCDSGFGHQLAKRLQCKGFVVFAGCLFPKGSGAKELQETSSSRLKVLPLDVRSDKSVADALKFVKENLGSNVLWAVVNNAGISKGSSFDFSTIEHFKDTIDVNTIGPVRVCKAFLPMLKNSKGRIVNVASLLGRIPTSDVCPYTMSKHATVALSECLSLEMAAWGVRVISIEPEAFRTPITDIKAVASRMKAELKEIDESIISSYGEDYFEKLVTVIERVVKYSASRNTNVVVDAMESAVIKKHPYSVYKPRWSRLTKFLMTVYEVVPFSFQERIFAVMSTIMQRPVPKDAK